MNFLKGLLNIGLLMLYAISAFADPISLNIYPTSLTVPYGASQKEMILQFYVVSNVSQPQKLSNFQLSAVTTPNPGTIQVTQYTTDCNGTLPPQGATGVCNIYAHLTVTGVEKGTANLLPTVNYQFKFGYNSGTRPVQYITSNAFPIRWATGQALPSGDRYVNFVNNCQAPLTPQNVWIGISSGAVDSITPDPSITPVDLKSCVNADDCYPGSTCTTVSTAPVLLKHCLWNNPIPDVNGTPGYEIAPGTIGSVVFPMYDNGIDPIWNGGFAARLECAGAGTSCKIADCGAASDGGCPLGGGFQTPNTTVEVTFLGIQSLVTNTSGYPDADTYDVSIINGVTGGGVSMQSTNGVSGGPSAPYTCGVPGKVTAINGLGACNWATMTPPATPLDVNGHTVETSNYIWVDTTGGSGSCPSCTTGVCGHTIDQGTGVVSASPSCGTQLGLLTADAICAKDSTFGAPFDCNSKVTQNAVKYTYADIYGCAVGEFANSCYSAGATSACCGCQDWSTAATFPAVIPASTQSCGGISNTNWLAIAEPSLSWLKQACPTAYVFPYDDASSTFGCQVLDPTTHINKAYYQVTFCPTT